MPQEIPGSKPQIALRVQRAAFDLTVGLKVYALSQSVFWIRGSRRFRSGARSALRATFLIASFFGTLGLLYYFITLNWSTLTFPSLAKADYIELSKAWAYPLLIISGLPVLFVLWTFRDSNARQKIANDRKDVNLKEFQELQLRASGLFPPGSSPDAVRTLQTASIYQLAGFIRGEYGANFQRPTFETLVVLAEQFSLSDGSARLSKLIERAAKRYRATRWAASRTFNPLFISNFLTKVKNLHREHDSSTKHSPAIRVLSVNIRHYASSIPLSRIALYRLFGNRTNFTKLIFDRVRLVKGQFAWSNFNRATIHGSGFYFCSFVKSKMDYFLTFNTDFIDCRFQELVSRRSDYQSCSFLRSQIHDCDFRFSTFDQCDFTMVTLHKVDLRGASLKWANFRQASLHDVDLRGTDLRAVDPNVISSATGCKIDRYTRISMQIDQREDGWFDVDAEAARRVWLEKGATYVEA